jgi:hypothetical protein
MVQEGFFITFAAILKSSKYIYHMKKKFLAGAFLCLLAGQTYAQSKGSYVKLGAGYQFGIARQAMQYHDYEFSGSYLIESDTRHSLQTGIMPLASFGYMFNENIGFEVGVNYLIGKSSEIHQEFEDQNGSQNHLMKMSSNSLMVTPSLRFAVPLSKNVSIYSRSGLVIPVLSRVKKNQQSAYAGIGESHDIEINSVLKNHFTFGFSGALGFAFRTSKKTTFNVELAGQMLSLWASKEEIKSFKVDKTERKPSDYGYSTGTIYVTDISVDGKSGNALTYQSPFHSLGINIGMAFEL